uniref:Uncharacterized protein n=1 Tax=Heterorhabditis bacteriophora TaxID=37862 RepID=A0A1I7WM33_HETBA
MLFICGKISADIARWRIRFTSGPVSPDYLNLYNYDKLLIDISLEQSKQWRSFQLPLYHRMERNQKEKRNNKETFIGRKICSDFSPVYLDFLTCVLNLTFTRILKIKKNCQRSLKVTKTTHSHKKNKDEDHLIPLSEILPKTSASPQSSLAITSSQVLAPSMMQMPQGSPPIVPQNLLISTTNVFLSLLVYYISLVANSNMQPQYAYQQIVQPDGKTYYQQVLLLPSQIQYHNPSLSLGSLPTVSVTPSPLSSPSQPIQIAPHIYAAQSSTSQQSQQVHIGNILNRWFSPRSHSLLPLFLHQLIYLIRNHLRKRRITMLPFPERLEAEIRLVKSMSILIRQSLSIHFWVLLPYYNRIETIERNKCFDGQFFFKLHSNSCEKLRS